MIPAVAPTGVLLLTFGSAVTAEDVPAYLRSVRGGNTPSPDVIAEFQRRYRVIGRSPLIDITLAQATALQELLDDDEGIDRYAVAVGMLHSTPSVPSAVQALAERGARHIIAIVMAPQYSPLVLAGYERAVATQRDAHPGLDIRIAGAWHTTPGWIDSLAERVRTALDAVPDAERAGLAIIFTAHSLPRPVVERDPGYIDQLRETASAVAARAGLRVDDWQFAYQSAGHTPEEWLKPDVKDLLPGLREAGRDSVLIVPVQFLADHLEILYDIDVAAREEAEAHGLRFRRIAMPNTSPAFIRSVAAVVHREVASAPRQ